jgi:hypothetical protein
VIFILPVNLEYVEITFLKTSEFHTSYELFIFAHSLCPPRSSTKQHHQWAALSHPAQVCVRRADYVRERALVVKLQARVRGWLLRRGMRHWHVAATMVRCGRRRGREEGCCHVLL